MNVKTQISMMDDLKDRNSWAVIFDMDGVLIDSYRAHFLSWCRMLRNHGLNMTEEQFASTFGRTNSDILYQLYPSVMKGDYALLAVEKEALYREIIMSDFPKMDGASELIADLHKAGAALAIGSSAPPENVRAVLKKLSGGERFTVVTNGNEVTRGKPDPEVFIKTIQKLALPSWRCVVVEDAPAGVLAGKAAGCPVAALTGTASRVELARADLVVDSLRELKAEILRDLIGDF